MKQYRLYVLNPEERVAATCEAPFPDDITALKEATEMRADQFAVEVWIGERLVGRVGGEFSL
ncbi:MAG: hypothetical protein V4597_11925 [Pseudomonadota bacterium]|uniref:hypothetical protein n=1 Tax=Phenylobacterium sp. TaxID=1871053 RepID=UPI002724BDD5|nr:hypothetical protein [Phenylobacterium sp.]MDO8377600.1 hypothetical protein [Phenylobacterium sp.]